jgi:anaerobic ribonucleoside-triphosphate reductase activating protein
VSSGLELNLHSILWQSQANGPGTRAVLWCQGCTLGCDGCFNAGARSNEPRMVVSITDLLYQLAERIRGIEGITISGGEPLQQAPAVAMLLGIIKEATSLSMILYTGYTWDEVRLLPEAWAILASLDVLIAGRYDETGRVPKTVHLLSPRYSLADIEASPQAEVILRPDGSTVLTGTVPLCPSCDGSQAGWGVTLP